MIKLPNLSRPKQKVNLLIAALFVAVQLPFVLLAVTAVSAVQPVDVGNPNPPGNNGTLKVHKQGSASGFEDNEPKVCEFNFEGFDFDEEQEGYIVIEGQGQSDGTDYGPYDIFGPTDDEGYYATGYFNTEPGIDDIDDGHYKATLYGKDNEGQIDLEDEKAKSKVFKVECDEEEDETGILQVNKVLLDENGDVQGGNTEANTLGFEWVLNGGTYSNVVKSMGASVTEVVAGAYTVTENIAEVEGYEFVGYYEGQEGTCDEVEEDTTLPISVNVVADATTYITLCNQEDEEGNVLGDSDTKVTTGQVLGASTQVVAPVGGVSAGAAAGPITGSLFGLGSSLTALGYGIASLRKKQ